jgi:phosphotransferase system IIB component
MAKILDLLKTEGKFSQAELKRVRGSLDHMSLADDHKISWL